MYAGLSIPTTNGHTVVYCSEDSEVAVYTVSLLTLEIVSALLTDGSYEVSDIPLSDNVPVTTVDSVKEIIEPSRLIAIRLVNVYSLNNVTSDGYR